LSVMPDFFQRIGTSSQSGNVDSVFGHHNI
jgi:hypothetical protein